MKLFKLNRFAFDAACMAAIIFLFCGDFGDKR